jgi:AraC family transcriptional regulator
VLFNIGRLARFVYLSSYRFSRAFKTSFGIAPQLNVVKQRIEQAKALLANSPYSVRQIGRGLGFKETRSFSAAFRNATGTSPSEYRRAQNGFLRLVESGGHG